MPEKLLAQLPGLGPKSQAMLEEIGIHDVDAFFASDPYQLFLQMRNNLPSVSINMLYAMIGAQENRHWQDIAKERKTEILMWLDDLGIAP